MADEVRGLGERARRLHQEGRLDEAAALFAEILADDPDCADALYYSGVIATRRRDFAKAEALFARAVAVRPDNGAHHHDLAVMHGIRGRLELAEKHFREAVRLRPDHAESYFNMAGTVKFRRHEPLFDAVEALLARPDLSRQDRCFLHFAAGKMYDDIGAHEAAFAHYHQGNMAKGVQGEPVAPEQRAADTVAAFTRERMAAHAGRGSDSRVPVFVVGMPRSGTSLVEQILASHPQVFGAGELPDIEAIAREVSKRADAPEVFEGFAGSYLRRVTALAPESVRIVDKQPLNFRHLGLIALMFPQAAIIHCRRHPVDTCVSCYFQNFRTQQDYSFDLAYLGLFYRYYRRLMEHWRAVLPRPFLDIGYEDLVADPAGQARRMLDHCGLDWDDACARPERSQRPVDTASLWQVRQPVYRTSVARWRRYERHLGPLLDALGPLAGDG